MDIKTRFAQIKQTAKPKSERLAALWLRGDILSSGSTEEITVIAKPSENGNSFEIMQGDRKNLDADKCRTVIGTLTAPEVQNKVGVKVDAEIFDNFIFRGILKIEGVMRQATLFVTSEEEIAARCLKSGAEAAKFPPAYILYNPDLVANTEPLPPKKSKKK